MRDDIRRLQSRIEKLKEETGIDKPNREAILRFLDECSAEGLSALRQLKYIYMLKAIATHLSPEGFLLETATEQELKGIVATINRSEYAEATKADLKKALKKYYRVQNGGVPASKATFIRAGLKKATPVTREDIFAPEEVRAIVAQLRNVRDRAFVMALYETGARPGELLACKIADVTFNGDGDFIFLQGLKDTPDRTNQLVEAGMFLREWIRCHPCGGDPHAPKDPRAPLWVKLEQTRCLHCGVPSQFHEQKGCAHFAPMPVEQAYYDNLRKNFLAACQKAGLKKRRFRLYSLRHSRLTEASMFMSNQQLCRFAGWQPGSGQFEVYVHLTNDDVNLAIRQHYGIASTEQKGFRDCPVCGHGNPANAMECKTCKRPMALEGISKAEQLRENVARIAELAEDGSLDRLLALLGEEHHSGVSNCAPREDRARNGALPH